jgi:hypothetical protein
MARTRVWATEEAGYTDATLATSIDNKGTDLRVDVREVVNQLIGAAEGTALADPVVNPTLVFAQQQTFQRNYSALGFEWNASHRYDPTAGAQTVTTPALSSPQYVAASGYIQATDATGLGSTPLALAGFRDLDLPVGITLTELTTTFWRINTTDQVELKLYSTALSTGTTTLLGTATSSGTTTGSILTQAMALADHTTLAANWYFMTITSSSGATTNGVRFYGVRADYTSPTANIRF